MIKQGVDRQVIVDQVQDKWTSWKIARQEKENIWRQCVNNYLTIVDTSRYENWPWRSKACDTVSQETADTIASSIINALFPTNEDFYQIHALDDQSKPYIEDLTTYFDTHLKRSRFMLKMRPFIKQMCVVGNTAASLPWIKKSRPKKGRARTGKGYTVQTNRVKTYDCFSFETLDVLDTACDPKKTYDSSSSLFIVREFKDMDELRRDKNYAEEDLGLIVPVGGEGGGPTSDQAHKSERAAAFGLSYEPSEDDVELLIAHGDFESGNDLYEDYLAVVANGVLIRFEENPFWGGRPFVWGTYDSLWFTPYGRGPLEPILGVHELINTFTNQKADILNLIIMGAFAYVRDGVVDPDTLVLRPGGGIEVGDINNIKELHPNTNVALAFQEIAMLRGRAEGSSAATYLERGIPSGGRKTAYETGILKQGSSSRINDIIRGVGEGVVEYTLNHFLESLKQFKFGSNEIPDEVLLGEYRLEYFGAENSVIRSQEMQTYGLFADLLGRYPNLANALDDREFMLEVRRILGIKNKNLIKSESRMKAEEARKVAIEDMSKLPQPQEQLGVQGQPGGLGG